MNINELTFTDTLQNFVDEIYAMIFEHRDNNSNAHHLLHDYIEKHFDPYQFNYKLLGEIISSGREYYNCQYCYVLESINNRLKSEYDELCQLIESAKNCEAETVDLKTLELPDEYEYRKLDYDEEKIVLKLFISYWFKIRSL